MAHTVSILVTCPKTLVTELLVAALSANPQLKVVAHEVSEAAIIEALEKFNVDIVLLDGDSVGEPRGGLELLGLLRRNAPEVNSVVLLEKRDRHHVVECFRNGAKGVFSKGTSDFNLLCKCLKVVSAGEFWASSEELGWIIDALETSISASRRSSLSVVNAQGQNLLSKREVDVVRLVMEGMSNRDIAQSLNLSEHTIKNYLFRIFDKLGVSSRTELLVYAMNFRMSETPQARPLLASAS